jgi:hypothetical protein
MDCNKIRLLFCLFFFSAAFLNAESSAHKEIKIKKISSPRINQLAEKYNDFILQQRIKEGAIGAIKLSIIGSIVYALYYPASKNTTAKDMPHDGWGLTWRRIFNDACIAAFVTLMLNGINNSLNNISDAFYGSVTNKCEIRILKRFLFELRRYKAITTALREDEAFISKKEILISYNRILTSLEHVIAWAKLDCIEPRRKNIFASILSFVDILEEYELYLKQTEQNAWSPAACKKLGAITHTFLFPWIDTLSPEIPND